MAETTCLVYAPYSFSGRGPAESCARIVSGAAATGLRVHLYAGRLRQSPDRAVRTTEPLGAAGRVVPWRYIESAALAVLERRYAHDIARSDPASTVAYFWPGTPSRLVSAASSVGIVTVREMINTACATSGPILDTAYERLGLQPSHPVTAEVIAGETQELLLYDYLFASNPEVERSLLRIGVDQGRIITTTFGWDPTRLSGTPTRKHSTSFNAVFVGRVGVRKGVPELLEAWTRAKVDGELTLAGPIDQEIAPIVERYVAGGNVRALGFVDNPATVYADADVFVFPTLEEGGPQVTYEAAGSGLPVITTPMGAARLVETGRNGIVVPPGDSVALARALRTLADDAELRHRYGTRAREDAEQFDYPTVGASRAVQLRALVKQGS